MENKGKIRAIIVLGIVMLIIAFSSYSSAIGVSTLTTQTVTETLPSINGFNSTSPLVLSNFTGDLLIQLGHTFTLAKSGFGSANYGIITVLGTLIINNPLINYGTIVNSGTINISSTLVNINDSTQSFTTTGIVTNSGTITNNGFVYNDNSISNLGNITNTGSFSNCISGLSYTGKVTGNAVQGVVKTSC